MKPGGLTIEAASGCGLIRVEGSGFWSPAVMDAHFDELSGILVRYRAAGTAVKMVVDLRASGVQSQETMVRMQAGVSSITQPGDRMAIVVNSSLAKMQMRRVIGDEQHAFFVSPEAALKWAEAY
jgi:hypothetical protein